jgi:anthranilate synthase component 1
MTEDGFLEEAYRALEEHPLACFLDSAGPAGQRSRWMFLSGPVGAVIVESGEEVRYLEAGNPAWQSVDRDRWYIWLQTFQRGGWDIAGPTLFPLLTYEAYNPWTTPTRPHPLWTGPEAVWLLAPSAWVYDRESQTLHYRKHVGPRIDAFPLPSAPEISPGWRESEHGYHHKIGLVQDDIYEGNYYQANLSQRYLCAGGNPPLETYRALRALNPSPFMGVFRLDELWVLSGSPERLVLADGEHISARPIAGTRPRHTDPGRDEAMRKELIQSPKEQAEHLMLVDLIRNDLGRVAAPGSVRVDEFAVIESYSHVHHLVSEVTARLAEGNTLVDLIQSVFPGGTITGAPKISCMQRLSVLEEEARGPYTGSMGYVNGQGRADFNILIRTLIQRGERVCFHGGGGIVADSGRHAEYMETRYKCMALMEALGVTC